MRIAAHSSPVTYAGQKSAKTPYFVEKKCLTALGAGQSDRRAQWVVINRSLGHHIRQRKSLGEP
jgi:hypothetical protein